MTDKTKEMKIYFYAMAVYTCDRYLSKIFRTAKESEEIRRAIRNEI